MSKLELFYEPNEIESDMLLSEMPLSLMKENIIAQFEDPLEYRKKDHITTFLNMYEYSKENADLSEDEEMDNVIELRDDFYSFMQKLFKDYLNIGFVDFDDESEEDQDNLIHFTYRYFIMNIKKNFVSYILNWIDDHKEVLMDADDDKKKDVTSMSFKKEITDPTDIYILSNLSDIIDMTLNELVEDVLIDEFFEKCGDEDCLETRIVSNAFENMKITGNFVEKYVDMLDSDFKSEIESKVRNKILKRYKKK